jgi:hypothetical protein
MTEAKFCRACGMDISAVPMLMTGQLTANVANHLQEEDSKDKKKKKKKEPTYSDAFENIFTGAAFLIIFLAGFFFFVKFFWVWIWFIIPALACVGSGVGQLFQIQQQQKTVSQLVWSNNPTLFQSQPRVNELPSRNTTEFMDAPPSITENTTRHLGAELPTRVFDKNE